MATIVNSTFESTVENHQAWFDTTVTRSTAAAHTGTASLLVEVAAQFTGVQLSNYPYYAGFTPGNDYDFSLWYVEATSTMPTVSWNILWYDGAVALLRTDTVSMPRAVTWTEVTTTLTAPVGAVTVAWTFTTTSGVGGSAYRVDDLLIEDAASAGTAVAGQSTVGASSHAHAAHVAVGGGRAALGTTANARVGKTTPVRGHAALGAAARYTIDSFDITGTLVAGRNLRPARLVTDSGGTYRLKQVAEISVSALQLTFANWYAQTAGVGDVDGSNDYVIQECYLEHDGALTPVTFAGGATSVTVPAGGDTHGTVTKDITAGETYYVRTYVTPVTGGSYPVLFAQAEFPDELHAKGANYANELGTANLGSFGDVFGPIAITGTKTDGPCYAVDVIGDSIANGDGDDFGDYDHVGYIYRALNGHRPFLIYPLSGEQAAQFITMGTKRARFIGPAAHYLIDAYGINDLQAGRTLAQLQASKLTIWSNARSLNPTLRVVPTTLTPKSSSTDGWVTTVNQTSDFTVEAVRPHFNNWVRAGCPIIGGVAVAVGTPGALLAGQPGHPAFGYFEIADLAESARDSGVWRVDGGAHTGDGVHPNVLGHTTLVPGISLATLVDTCDVVITTGAGVATVGATTTGTIRKVTAHAGSATVGATGYVTSVATRAVRGVTALGAAGRVTATHAHAVVGRLTTGLSSLNTVVKISSAGGVGVLGPTVFGGLRRSAPVRGETAVGLRGSSVQGVPVVNPPADVCWDLLDDEWDSCIAPSEWTMRLEVTCVRSISVTSIEYVRVRATRTDVPDLSLYLVEIGFTTSATDAPATYGNAQWETGGRVARVLIGSTGVALARGVYYVWVRLTYLDEVPARPVGTITIF